MRNDACERAAHWPGTGRQGTVAHSKEAARRREQLRRLPRAVGMNRSSAPAATDRKKASVKRNWLRVRPAAAAAPSSQAWGASCPVASCILAVPPGARLKSKHRQGIHNAA